MVGAQGCLPLLPKRSLDGVRQQAVNQGLEWEHAVKHRGLVSPVPVHDLPRVLAMHNDGQSHEEIATAFGICPASAANALAVAKCRASGRTPARRAPDGSLMIKDLKRLHALFEAGARGVDIQVELGISASSVSTHRRRRNAELKAQGLPPLPPAGGGQRYCGARMSAADRRAVVALFMEGYGAKTIARRIGIGQTTAKRVRDQLIKKLKRRGESLPGCDANGKRLKVKEPSRKLDPAAVEALRAHLLNRIPVQRASRFTGIGITSAYRIRDALAAELAAEGKLLPKPKLPGKSSEGRRPVKDVMPAPIAAPRRLSFDEQLQRVREGAAVVPRFKPSVPIAHTLGGVGSGML